MTPPVHKLGASGRLADDKLSTICRATFDALAVVDDDRRYLRANDSAVEMLGAPRDRVLRSRIDDFTRREDHPVLNQLWDRLVSEGEVSGPYRVLRGDGSRAAIEFRATWGFDDGQHLIVARNLSRPIIAAADGDPQLTAREREVVQLASNGLTIREIGDELCISAGTVKTHFENVYGKLRARDRASAVAEALRRGLIA